MTQVSTFFALMAEYGTAEIPLEKVCEKYFGLNPRTAAERAPKRLPCPAYRMAGQKSKWLVSAKDLAEMIDSNREKAKEEWQKFNH